MVSLDSIIYTHKTYICLFIKRYKSKKKMKWFQATQLRGNLWSDRKEVILFSVGLFSHDRKHKDNKDRWDKTKNKANIELYMVVMYNIKWLSFYPVWLWWIK